MPSLETRMIADLKCHIITAEKPECLVVLCHGFGAPGDDLVQIGAYLIESRPELKDRVVIAFPEAPLSLEEMGMPRSRAWWPLDMEKLNQAVESGDFRDLRNESPELLPDAREKLIAVMDQLQEEYDIGIRRTIVGGFSQGSMLATDYALQTIMKPAGLIIWSGTLLNEPIWKGLAESMQGIPILQSHGTSDNILPFKAAGWLREMLSQGGADVNFLQFSGGHTISPESLDAAGEMILSTLNKES
ncbi:phospholipase [bacterium]|jgi:phospholipase/carboxylesterase|nr:phospholipase [bacterium]MDA7527777.1 phospholipase [bacterium]MDB4802348.1 phospholipase [bacterium]